MNSTEPLDPPQDPSLGASTPGENTEQDHQRQARKRQAGYDKKQANATREKGLLVVNTGPGKGKSTAAFGMALRAVGHGIPVGVVQFIKGAMDSAERRVLSSFPQVTFHAIGDGFTWHTQNRQRDMATAARAFEVAAAMLADPRMGLVILDELNVILKYQYLDLDTVLATLQGRPEGQHVVITGRNAPEALVASADLVSEIRAIKHPYKTQGIKAQPGIEF
ncbi:MAG: cob(I)yrinic acid a,c-diamide adenosyltransferase [Candidatus Competibacterales bacterium]